MRLNHPTPATPHAIHVGPPEAHMRRYDSVEPAMKHIYSGQEPEERTEDEPEERVEAEEHIVLPHLRECGACGEPDTVGDDDIRSAALF